MTLALDRDHNDSKDQNRNSILVVDDEYDIVNLIKQSLEANGQRVCGFSDAKAALDHSNSDIKDNHDLVISDIRMPGMNGYELVARIRKTNPKTKVFLMSAFEIEDEEFHNMLPGIRIDGFIQKPFSIRALRDMVQKNIVLS